MHVANTYRLNSRYGCPQVALVIGFSPTREDRLSGSLIAPGVLLTHQMIFTARCRCVVTQYIPAPTPVRVPPALDSPRCAFRESHASSARIASRLRRRGGMNSD